jgi:acyl-CoA synthetase (AMP-forming)/AMP-acid ligase II
MTMNVGAFLTKSARLHPQRVAVSDGSSTLTYAELNSQAASFAAGLLLRGYARGDRVAIVMPNRTEYLVALFGLFKGGFVAVPVNTKLHSSEIAFILAQCEARAVVFSAKSRKSVEAALSLATDIDPIRVDGEANETLADIIEAGNATAGGDAEVSPDDVAWIFYTSGTTGRPKGAMLSHRNLCASAMNCLADMLDFQPEDVALHVAPLSHGSGLYALPAIARGTKNIVYSGSSFDAQDVLRTMEREGVTIIPFLAPTMIHMLVETDPSLTAPRFRRTVYGGAPIDPQLAEAAIERFGRVFVQLYGQGEAPMTISRLRPEDHTGQLLYSAGTIRTDVEVRLFDEQDRPVAEGQEGEVCVRGDVVMQGYWNDEDANAQALRGGWLHTGDIGRFEDGFLYLLSRKNDVIISGGTNIYPREVEDALLLHPAVQEACVFGEPDAKWGESIVAAVVTSGSVSVEDLQAFCREHIASFKKPKRIEFLDGLPKHAYGKVLRRQVKEQLASS